MGFNLSGLLIKGNPDRIMEDFARLSGYQLTNRQETLLERAMGYHQSHSPNDIYLFGTGKGVILFCSDRFKDDNILVPLSGSRELVLFALNENSQAYYFEKYTNTQLVWQDGVAYEGGGMRRMGNELPITAGTDMLFDVFGPLSKEYVGLDVIRAAPGIKAWTFTAVKPGGEPEPAPAPAEKPEPVGQPKPAAPVYTAPEPYKPAPAPVYQQPEPAPLAVTVPAPVAAAPVYEPVPVAAPVTPVVTTAPVYEVAPVVAAVPVYDTMPAAPPVPEPVYTAAPAPVSEPYRTPDPVPTAYQPQPATSSYEQPYRSEPAPTYAPAATAAPAYSSAPPASSYDGGYSSYAPSAAPAPAYAPAGAADYMPKPAAAEPSYSQAAPAAMEASPYAPAGMTTEQAAYAPASSSSSYAPSYSTYTDSAYTPGSAATVAEMPEKEPAPKPSKADLKRFPGLAKQFVKDILAHKEAGLTVHKNGVWLYSFEAWLRDQEESSQHIPLYCRVMQKTTADKPYKWLKEQTKTQRNIRTILSLVLALAATAGLALGLINLMMSMGIKALSPMWWPAGVAVLVAALLVFLVRWLIEKQRAIVIFTIHAKDEVADKQVLQKLSKKEKVKEEEEQEEQVAYEEESEE